METGLIIGRIPVEEYLKAGMHSQNSQLILQNGIKKAQLDSLLKLSAKAGVRVQYRDKQYVSKLAKGENHQGVILTDARLFRALDASYEELAARDSVIILLDQITDPHNLGAIIRSAEALGADAVVVPGAHQASVTSTAVKSSAGATAHLPVSIVSNLAQEMDKLKNAGFWIAGSSDHGTHSLSEVASIRPLALVIGSEGEGMRRLTEKKCDYICSIPLKGKVSSLNASVAAGILLFAVLS